MDGVEATRRIRAGDDAPRVLILTTFDLDEYVYEAIKAGASGFLLKDTGASNLIDGIRIVHSGDAVVAPSTTRRLLDRFATRLPSVREEAPPRGLAMLTERELEVLRLLAAGRSNQRIAHELVVTLDTVKKHVTHILGKLGAANRTEAVARARDLGLIP